MKNTSKRELLIKIRDKQVAIVLKRRNKTLDELEFPENRNLTERLLLEIDKLLRRNKLGPEDIKKVKFSSDEKNAYTTNRIGMAVAKAWNWTLTRF